MNTVSDGNLLASVRACMQAALKLSDADTAGINLDTTPVQVPGWTSMAHLELVLAVENRFGLMFDADEIADLASVSAMVGALERRAG